MAQGLCAAEKTMRLRMDDDDDDAVNSHARARGKSRNVSRTRPLRVLNHMLFSAYFCTQKQLSIHEVHLTHGEFSSLSSILFNEHFYSIFLSSLIEARDTVNWVRARSTLRDIVSLWKQVSFSVNVNE